MVEKISFADVYALFFFFFYQIEPIGRAWWNAVAYPGEGVVSGLSGANCPEFPRLLLILIIILIIMLGVQVRFLFREE